MEGIPQSLDKEEIRKTLTEQLEALRTELDSKELAMHQEMARSTGVDTVPLQLEVDKLRSEIETKELELAKFDGRA
jgi:hypothetical protein